MWVHAYLKESVNKKTQTSMDSILEQEEEEWEERCGAFGLFVRANIGVPPSTAHLSPPSPFSPT